MVTDNIVTITRDEENKIAKAIAKAAWDDEPIPELSCPKCHSVLIVKSRYPSYSVECPTPDCIKYSVRGL